MAIALVHAEAKNGNETLTIPLATWAGAGRTALVVVSWQGAAHGSGDMGATPTVFTEHLRTARPVDFTPAIAVWSAAIDTASDVILPISHQGCGFALWVVTGFSSLVVADLSTGFGTGYGVAGAGDEFTIGAVSTNAQKTVTQTGGFTLTAPPIWYSETVGVHAQPGVTGALGWGGDTAYAGVTLEMNAVQTVYQWTNQPDTIVSGTQSGSGLGVDVTSSDTNGVTVAVGQTLEVVDKWAVDPAGPDIIDGWQTRATLPSDYPADQGYRVTWQLEDGTGNVVKPWRIYQPLTGTDTGIIPAETRIFDTGLLTGLTWPDGGANPQLRIRFTPETVDNLRPVVDPGGGGGIPGRLGRPRMVELWRSQGETVGGPTLTVPDRWVDPINGSNANDGMSEGTAWQTMGHAMTQTDGLGVGIGYKSGTVTVPINRDPDAGSGAGSGTSFATGMNTHYVLEGHTVKWRADFRYAYAMKFSHMRYLQFSGFTIESTVNALGGIEDGSYGLHVQDYQNQDDGHHFVIADCTAVGLTGSGIAGFGARYVRVLGCEIYDCGHWTAVGGSGMTWNDCDRTPSNADNTPAGYVNGLPVDIWVQSCYISGSRQKIDSYNINPDVNGRYPGGYNVTTDGNAFALDYWHESNGNRETDLSNYPIRAAHINCVAHNSGAKSYGSFQAPDEAWYINCLGAYGGRHIQYVNTAGDPVEGMNPSGQMEYVVQAYPASDPNSGGKEGRLTTVHYWNCAAVAGSWMGSSPAFGAWGANVISVDAQNNKRTIGYSSDSYSTVMTDPLLQNADTDDGTLFDPRPTDPASPLLTGGDLALIALCTDDQLNPVGTDFAGNTLEASGDGHVGPYATSTAATVPAAPTNLDGTVNDQRISLSWVAPTDNGGSPVTDYVIQYRTNNPQGTWQTHPDGTSTATSGFVDGLTNDVAYDFRVAAVNIAGTGPYTSPITGTPKSWVRSTSTGSRESAGTSFDVTLPADIEVGDQIILNYYCTASGAPTASGYTVSGAGQLWLLEKTATISDPSSVVTITQPSGAIGVICIVFANPEGAWGFNYDGNNPTDAVTGEFTVDVVSEPADSGFVVFGIRTNATGWSGNNSGMEVKVTENINATWTLALFTEFLYSAETGTRTLAVTPDGLTNAFSGYTYAIPISASPIGATVPQAPTGLAADPNDAAVALSWTAPTDDGGAAITDYLIEYNPGGAGWQTFTDTVSAATTVNVTGLTNGVAHDFRVSAINSAGTGPASSVASATPAASAATAATSAGWDWSVPASRRREPNTGIYWPTVARADEAATIVTGIDGGAYTEPRYAPVHQHNWAAVESTQGVFDWSSIDASTNQYATKADGVGYWLWIYSHNTNHPSWLGTDYRTDVRNLWRNYNAGTGTWDFNEAMRPFINALVARYINDPHCSMIEMRTPFDLAWGEWSLLSLPDPGADTTLANDWIVDWHRVWRDAAVAASGDPAKLGCLASVRTLNAGNLLQTYIYPWGMSGRDGFPGLTYVIPEIYGASITNNQWTVDENHANWANSRAVAGATGGHRFSENTEHIWHVDTNWAFNDQDYPEASLGLFKKALAWNLLIGRNWISYPTSSWCWLPSVTWPQSSLSGQQLEDYNEHLDIIRWSETQLGKQATDQEEAFTFLGSRSHHGDTSQSNNIGRWIQQIDKTGGQTVVSLRIVGHGSGYGYYVNSTNDYISRRTNIATNDRSMFFDVDNRLVPAAASVQVKVIYRAGPATQIRMHYSTAAGPQVTPAVTTGTTGTKHTATFTMPNLVLAGAFSGSDLQLENTGSADVDVETVRFIVQ